MNKKFKIIILTILCTTMLGGCEKKQLNEKNVEHKKEIIENKDTYFEEVFTYEDIPDEIYNKMIGKSIPKEELVDRNSLSYLRLSYYGFDDEYHVGEMIVSKSVAQDVVDIFKELYDSKYPIEKMVLIDEYDAVDEYSMNDNNTSSFCYRKIGGSDKLSKHSLGLAIDINPLINPMVKGDKIAPKNGIDYIDRDNDVKGMIKKGDVCYEAFTKRGWTWGGDWNTLKDYQHFEKKI